MNFAGLFLNPAGRLSRHVYWLALAGLLAVSLLTAPLFAILGVLLAPLVLYCFSVLLAKRLRDFGMKGRLAALPFVVLLVYAFLIFAFAFLTLGGGGHGTGGSDTSRVIFRWLRNSGGAVAFLLPAALVLAGLPPTRAAEGDPLKLQAGPR